MRVGVSSLLFVVGAINSSNGDDNNNGPNSNPRPLTVAEASGYEATSRSAEVIQFMEQVDSEAEHIQCFRFGTTVEKRPMMAAVVANPPVARASELADDSRLVVLLMGNIHSGECAGKEALLMLLRELSQRPDDSWLKNMVLVFVPNYNADGNDQVSKDNRRGQIGPVAGMGKRQNSQGYDLNRDYVKVDSPECRALLGLINQWDPHLFMDLHTTNGSLHRYALTYDVPHHPASPAVVRNFMRNQMMPSITDALEARQIPTFYYGNFNREHTRWSTFGDSPRFGTEYVGLRGRLSILAEAYAYISYKERIIASREFVRECLNFTSSRSAEIQQILRDVRDQATAAGNPPAIGDTVALRSERQPLPDQVTVRGYSPPSSPRDRNRETLEPKDYAVDFYTNFTPTLEVQRPYAYLLPQEETDVIDRLRAHGIDVGQLKSDKTLEVEVYRVQTVRRSPRTYQGHQLVQAEVESRTEKRNVASGSYVIQTSQPLSNLVVYLLEPASSDGLLTWNFFDGALEEGQDFAVLRIAVRVDLPVNPNP